MVAKIGEKRPVDFPIVEEIEVVLSGYAKLTGKRNVGRMEGLPRSLRITSSTLELDARVTLRAGFRILWVRAT
jgi:hypothetical protein